MRAVLILFAIPLMLSACGSDVRFTEWETAETQRYETCRAIGHGMTWVDKMELEKAHGRFKYAKKSADAFLRNYPNDADAATLTRGVDILAAIPPGNLDGPGLSPGSVAAVGDLIDLCNGLPTPD